MRSFDGVVAMHSSALLFAAIGAIPPAPMSELMAGDPDEQSLQVLGSPDGRFTDADRPVVTEGGLPIGDHEVFINAEEREVLERKTGQPLAVGDTIDLTFWWSGLELAITDPSTVVEPIGVEEVRVAGFGHLPDEVLPDELYPRLRVIVSADLARKYSCTGDFRADMTDDEAAAAAFPPTCAQQYWFYSFELDGSPGVAASFRRQFSEASERLSTDLPPWVTRQAGYFYISQDRAVVAEAVQRATRPAVTALIAFALVALMTTLVVFGIAATRILRRAESESRALRQLGAGLDQRFVCTFLPIAGAVLLGVGGALVVGVLLSPLGPVGSVRDLAGTPGPSLPMSVTLLVAAVLVVALFAVSALVVVVAQRRACRSERPSTPRVAFFASRLLRSNRPAMTTGASAALDLARPGTVAAILGCMVAVVCVVASFTFGTTLTTLVDNPIEYGWPWDVAVITNFGFDSAVPEEVAASLDGDPDVEDYVMYGFDSSALVGDQGVPVVFDFSPEVPVELPVIHGRAPRAAGEAVLGSKTIGDLGVSIGDRVTIRPGALPERSVMVVGTAVLPAVGSFVSDRTGLGQGAFVLTDDEPTPDTASFVAVNVRDGVDPAAFLERLAPALPGWDATGAPPLTYDRPIRSAEIVNVSELRSAPLLLGGVLGLGLLVGLALSIMVSVRDRWHELAILRALGFGDRELRASVRWQACAMMAAGLVVGVPVGMVVGRLAWSAFAEQLGVALRAGASVTIVAVTVAGAMVVALIAAALPARSSTRSSRAHALQKV